MLIEVWTKEEYSSNEEKALLDRLSRAGLEAKGARLSRLYNIEAPWSGSDFSRLAADLLADRITERSSLSRRPGLGGSYRVEVWLKRSATDVVGESVKEAVTDLLGKAPAGVRFGRAYYLKGPSGAKPAGGRDPFAAKVRAVVAKTLANGIVQNFTVE